MENMPWVYCGRMKRHIPHSVTCPGTGTCGSRDIHDPHLVLAGSLAPYWCFGDRIRLYREKHVTNDGRKVMDTTWSNDPTPLMMMEQDPDDKTGYGHEGSVLVGMITSIQREPDTGWVTGLMTMQKPRNMAGYAAEADFDMFTSEKVKDRHGQDVLVIGHARLVAVTLGKTPTWRDMVIP